MSRALRDVEREVMGRYMRHMARELERVIYGTQQSEAQTVSDTNTLDGMSITQLRELARRAEAAAKVQEDGAYVVLGKGMTGYVRRVRKSDGLVESQNDSGSWSPLVSYGDFKPMIQHNGSDPRALRVVAQILTQLADKGGLK